MTEPRNRTRVDPISGAMGLKKQEINGQLLTCRPDNCTDTALHLVQKLYTLLIYQWVGRFRPLLNTSKTPGGPSTHKNAALVMPKFGLTVEKRPGAAIEGGSTRIHLLANSELTQVKQNTTSTAREFRGTSRKPGIRVNQGDNQILSLLTSFVYQKIARMFVSKCGQQEGLYQRLLKMPQPVGGRTTKQEKQLVHPAGTSISKYRRNQVFHIADSRQGMGTSDPSEIERRLFSAQ